MDLGVFSIRIMIMRGLFVKLRSWLPPSFRQYLRANVKDFCRNFAESNRKQIFTIDRKKKVAPKTIKAKGASASKDT